MKFRGKHDASALAASVRNLLKGKKGVTEKPMMGGICFMLRDHMLCGTAKPGYMFRVGKENDREALSRPGAVPISLGGTRRPGFVWVDPDKCDGRQLKSWIALAESYVGKLPPKRK